MTTEDERRLEIVQALREYSKSTDLSAFYTPHYFSRQIVPDESYFLKCEVISNLIESGIMVMVGEKWVIKDM
jgi:hypothetical protein